MSKLSEAYNAMEANKRKVERTIAWNKKELKKLAEEISRSRLKELRKVQSGAEKTIKDYTKSLVLFFTHHKIKHDTEKYYTFTCPYDTRLCKIGMIDDCFYRLVSNNEEITIEFYRFENITKSDEFNNAFMCTRFNEDIAYVDKSGKIKVALKADHFDAFNYWGEWGQTIRYKEFKRDILSSLKNTRIPKIHDSLDPKDNLNKPRKR